MLHLGLCLSCVRYSGVDRSAGKVKLVNCNEIALQYAISTGEKNEASLFRVILVGRREYGLLTAVHGQNNPLAQSHGLVHTMRTCTRYVFTTSMFNGVVYIVMCFDIVLPVATGREVTPNCGFDDQGGQHELKNTPCKNNTYNGGRWFYCKPCSACPPGYASIPCNATTDSRCQGAKVLVRTAVQHFDNCLSLPELITLGGISVRLKRSRNQLSWAMCLFLNRISTETFLIILTCMFS